MLPLTDYLIYLLEGRKNNSTSIFVFSGNNPDKPIVNPHKQIKKVRENSGVNFTQHDLRRTFATIADSLDIQYHIIKRLMNHSNNDVTIKHYVQLSIERLREPICGEPKFSYNPLNFFIKKKERDKQQATQYFNYWPLICF